LAVVAGISAFFALAARSDENLELAKTEGSINDTVEERLKAFRRWRNAGLVLIIGSAICLVAGAWTSLSVLLASDAMRQP
jgi:precorrin-2 methylase